MLQSKLNSLTEALLNILIGATVALITQLIIFPIYDIHIALDTDLRLTFWFTLVSLVRSYVLRRLFNKHTERTYTHDPRPTEA